MHLPSDSPAEYTTTAPNLFAADVCDAADAMEAVFLQDPELGSKKEEIKQVHAAARASLHPLPC
jgi:hypothetical protein